MKKILKEFCILFSATILCVSLQGCIVAAVGAGIAAVSYANSKKKVSYNQYLLGMEDVNMKRQKLHMKEEPIMTYKEYYK